MWRTDKGSRRFHCWRRPVSLLPCTARGCLLLPFPPSHHSTSTNMKFHKLLQCFCVSVLSIAVSAIQTSTSISSSAPTALSLSTPAIEKSAPLFIDTSGRPPDIIGISQVSSLYGPGSWSIWLITLCGSWLHIFVDHDKLPIDLNTQYLVISRLRTVGFDRLDSTHI